MKTQLFIYLFSLMKCPYNSIPILVKLVSRDPMTWVESKSTQPKNTSNLTQLD